MSSPQKKKMKITETVPVRLKREAEEESVVKRAKIEQSTNNVDVQALKRRNFIKACIQVSHNAYFDFSYRLQLVYIPPCMNIGKCHHLHSGTGTNVSPISDYVEQSIKIELNTYTWFEALEICQVCLTPDQYLTAYVLKEIVEMMLNAQEDNLADYTIDYLLDRCQQILAQNFSMHPPCLKTQRNLYKNFLTSPMDSREKTFSNRKEFDYDKGIVKYLMNRLEYEISLESKNEAIIDKDENTPEEMKQSVQGLHWQKEKFEIFETLERPERIRRIMAVLESLVELLQFDLAIWHARYNNNLGRHVMRSDRPLIAFILWPYNVLLTGSVNNNVRQILRLFTNMIHLQYPQDHIKILSTWLTVIIQMFYICELNANNDYPNTGKYCTAFARKFYNIIAEMPHTTIIRILEQIFPTFMQHLIGLLHMQSLLATNEDDIIKIFIKFVKDAQWKLFPDSQTEIKVTKSFIMKPKKVKDTTNFISKLCKNAITNFEDTDEMVYPKLDPASVFCDVESDRSHVIHALYITVDAYLDAYSVRNVQDTIDSLNEQINESSVGDVSMAYSENCSYSVSEHFIKKYRSMYRNLTELVSELQSLDKEQVPEIKIFERIGLLY